jgi:hypothetical protein
MLQSPTAFISSLLLSPGQTGKNWHYLDCTTGNVMTYIHSLTLLPVLEAYEFGVYVPVTNRIYFSP